MAISPELEDLKRKKTELEGKLQSISDQEKTLRDDLEALEIKVEISQIEGDIKKE